MGCGASAANKDPGNIGVVPGDSQVGRRDSGIENKMEAVLKMKRKSRNQNIKRAKMEEEEVWTPPPVIEKDDKIYEMLLNTLTSHWLFNGITDLSTHKGIVDVMAKRVVKKGENVIKQGDEGTEFFIMSSGICSVSVNGNVLPHQMKQGSAFGDLALFYEAPRSATIRALADCVLWVLDQRTFRHFLRRQSNAFVQENLKFLKQSEDFKTVDESQLHSLAHAMGPMTFKDGDYIIKQGERGSIFYILTKGSCKVIENDKVKSHTMDVGDHFGELALANNDLRTASIVAIGDVECAGIDKQTFNEVLGTYEQFKTLKKGDVIIDPKFRKQAAPHMELSDLKELQVLGVGGFGLVTLVQHTKSQEVYALKKMQKQAIVEADMQQMIVNEKNFLVEMNNPFVLGARGTSSDSDCVYIVLEFLQGGDLFGLLEVQDTFDDKSSRFYGACTVEALAYVHSRNVVFRDLKLENLVLDHRGYCKLVDFGLAKLITGRTYTVCGSPRYCAPEMVTGKGHEYGVDWWALGIILYESLFAESPFASDCDDHLETFRNITKSKLTFPRDTLGASKEVLDIITKLCVKKSLNRLGCLAGKAQDVKNHDWFQMDGFSWAALEDQTMQPPWTPNCKSPTDGSNFGEVEIYEEHQHVMKYRKAKDPEAGWDENF